MLLVSSSLSGKFFSVHLLMLSLISHLRWHSLEAFLSSQFTFTQVNLPLPFAIYIPEILRNIYFQPKLLLWARLAAFHSWWMSLILSLKLRMFRNEPRIFPTQSITTTTPENRISKPRLWSSYKISHPRIQHHIHLTVYVWTRNLFNSPSLPPIAFQSLGAVHPSGIPLTCTHFFPPHCHYYHLPPGSDVTDLSVSSLLSPFCSRRYFSKLTPWCCGPNTFSEPSCSPLRGMVCFSFRIWVGFTNYLDEGRMQQK